MKAVIVGGGIGGLAAALALLKVGTDVTVLERDEAPREAGAGVQISPNGMRVLDWLEVGNAVRQVAFAPEAIEMRIGRSGRRIFRLPIGTVAEGAGSDVGASYVQIHRADLADILRETLEARSPGALKMGRPIIGYRLAGQGAEALERDGGAVGGDVVIGADGIGSAICAQMHPDAKAQFSGNAAWRAVIPIERFGTDVPPPTSCIWVGAGRHAVTTRVRGGKEINLVGAVEVADWTGQGWGDPGQRDEAIADFAGWHPTIEKGFAEAPNLIRWGLFDRDPLPAWSDGAVVLLGDAAHPMQPSMAQGAVQALEDAACLALMLKEKPDVPEALNRYYQARIDRVSRIAQLSARNANLFHRAGGVSGVLTYGPAWLAGHLFPAVLRRRSEWIYQHDPTSPLT
ncbi:FAD-dependent monooxygenase [Aestuariibius sp. 2305UL40-4]|uniref:FAD-dependent monooxygenase n=1 Tax=Aestuariibius violaceus TaxID=3234132 RepID=UPI00345E8351